MNPTGLPVGTAPSRGRLRLVDEKIWDQFEASDKLTGRRATYNKSLDTTSLDMSKVGV